ncbi:hypothetical protein [Hymenobacter rubripertinctus]|uniref:Glycerophosphoryl diester phosphodiesterase membrane domain-containing protein n=1 Tax=Hymenobacter rubripertinctus TaxID=2029981 RepID=A0A418R479_9BACT|nr:hypothetical protein [Hymenobacter rubripertinctus]RIY12174.1 hypothetical protein D0T11_05900 [Hymenobacter rubripertinctus]
MRHLAFNRPTDFLRRRDFSQKMEATFDFIRVHATPLLRVMLVLVLPLALLTGIGSGLMQSQLFASFGTMARQARTGLPSGVLPEVFTSAGLWITVLSGLLLFAMVHLVVYGYVVLQADRTTDSPVTPGQVWQVVKARFLGMVGSFLGLGLLFIAGSMAVGMVLSLGMVFFASVVGATWLGFVLILGLYVFMFYVMVALSLYFIVWLREGRGFFGSIGRCFQLIKGKWWSTFGLLVVITLIMYLILILAVAGLSAVGLPFMSLMKGETMDLGPLARVLLIVYAGLQTLILLTFYPLIMIALSFQYFNLVERRDGEGTRLLIDSIGAPVVLTQAQGLRPDDDGEY